MKIDHITNVSGGPEASGPYSLGVVAEGRYLFISGQGPYDPELGRFVCGSVAEQTELTLANLDRVIKAAGGSRENVVSCRVYLQQLTEANFKAMNEVYAKFYGDAKPSRTTIGCQLLNIDVEIDAVVLLPDAG
ncbi:MAG: RidA family protein [Chthoniobacterales bacterium]